MIPLAPILIAASTGALLLWIGLAIHVFAVERRRAGARALLASALGTLQRDDVRRLTVEERAALLVDPFLGASRELIMRAAADRETPDEAFDPLAHYLAQRWGQDGLLRDASGHRSERDKWRRTAALKILCRSHHPERMNMLARAVEQQDAEVASVALALLGSSRDSRALDILFEALRSQRHPASRVAAHIEQSPLPIVDRLEPLLGDRDPVMRLWGATLMARCPDDHPEAELALLTQDPDPRVRKAAVQSLGTIGGGQTAVDCALRLLTDPEPYVRAHAARALGELGRTDAAGDVAGLLGDADWWARLAARETLELMGADVWPVLMRRLEDGDRFVRNGAAEVLQNIGVLDSLIVMEAATDNPAESKIAMLRRIAAAGGLRFTDALVERAGPIVGPRIRQLLTTMGLAHVGAY